MNEAYLALRTSVIALLVPARKASFDEPIDDEALIEAAREVHRTLTVGLNRTQEWPAERLPPKKHLPYHPSADPAMDAAYLRMRTAALALWAGMGGGSQIGRPHDHVLAEDCEILAGRCTPSVQVPRQPCEPPEGTAPYYPVAEPEAKLRRARAAIQAEAAKPAMPAYGEHRKDVPLEKMHTVRGRPGPRPPEAD